MCFLFLDPYARYGRFKGFGILLHAQLSYWGRGNQRLDINKKSSLSCVLHMWGVCYFKARCFNRVLPPAGQNPGK